MVYAKRIAAAWMQARVAPGGEQLGDVYAEILRPSLSDVLGMTVFGESIVVLEVDLNRTLKPVGCGTLN
jgi:hypothetical protein